MFLTKGKWILIGVLIVLLGGTLTYFGWTKQKSEPDTSQANRTKSEPVRQVIIPSSLDPKNVIENVIDLPYYSQWETKGDYPFLEESWEQYFGIPSLGRGLIKYAGAPWLKSYSKRDGTELHQISEEVPLILLVHVGKYQRSQFAKEAYNKINIDQGFKVSILEGVELKTKPGSAPVIEQLVLPYIEPEQFQQYVIQSNNFIIYAFGLKEAAEDVMIRIIDQYGVK